MPSSAGSGQARASEDAHPAATRATTNSLPSRTGLRARPGLCRSALSALSRQSLALTGLELHVDALDLDVEGLARRRRGSGARGRLPRHELDLQVTRIRCVAAKRESS